MTTTTPQRSAEPGLEQLELLPAVDVPVQLRLSERTRRIGLAGVARVKAMLEEQATRRREAAAEAEHLSPPRAA